MSKPRNLHLNLFQEIKWLYVEETGMVNRRSTDQVSTPLSKE